MAAPTNTALVKKVLANSEPSTHGPSRQTMCGNKMSAYGARAKVTGACPERRELTEGRHDGLVSKPLACAKARPLNKIEKTAKISVFGSRMDVLIKAEQIIAIVFALEHHEAVVVFAIGGLHGLHRPSCSRITPSVPNGRSAASPMIPRPPIGRGGSRWRR